MKPELLVPLNNWKTLSSNLKVIDYGDAVNMLGSKLQVNLIKVPEYIQAVNYSPKSVEYILEK